MSNVQQSDRYRKRPKRFRAVAISETAYGLVRLYASLKNISMSEATSTLVGIAITHIYGLDSSDAISKLESEKRKRENELSSLIIAKLSEETEHRRSTNTRPEAYEPYKE